MNSAVCKDVATLLQDNGHGTLGADLFYMEWNKTDKQILVLDTEGFPTPLKDVYEQPAFQVLVRGSKTESGEVIHNRIRKIHDFLTGLPDLLNIAGTDYLGFEPMHNPSPMGRDDDNRFIYSCNYYTFRNPL